MCPHVFDLSDSDAIAKALYSVLFDWLLEQINEWLSPAEMDSTVGILDIYGFEVWLPNSNLETYRDMLWSMLKSLN